MRKTYRIVRRPDGSVGCQVKPVNGLAYQLRHVKLYSPTSFEVGNGGAGSADLALSIMADFLGEQPTVLDLRARIPRCLGPHVEFRWQFLATMDRIGGELSSDEIAAWWIMWQTEQRRMGLAEDEGEPG